MKVEEIERLLAEFYEGNTTESQEEALRDYRERTAAEGERDFSHPLSGGRNGYEGTCGIGRQTDPAD